MCKSTVGTPTLAQVEDMRHMLGMTGAVIRGQWGYRNHYAAGINDVATLYSMRQLVAMGLLEEGHTTINMTYFHCTEKGCKEAGLSKAGIKRVFGA